VESHLGGPSEKEPTLVLARFGLSIGREEEITIILQKKKGTSGDPALPMGHSLVKQVGHLAEPPGGGGAGLGG
jgi:hypothetical protein